MNTVEGKKQEKRRALLDAAYELFLERGASKTSAPTLELRHGPNSYGRQQ